MQLIAASRRVRPPVGAVVVSSLAGIALLAGGLFLGYLAFATPMVTVLTPNVIRPTLPQMALGGLIWSIALVAPPSFAFVGAWRLSRTMRALTARPGKRLLTDAASQLGDEYVAINDVILPEGRVIHDLVLGPFGIAVFGDVPPPRYVRRTGSAWEIRGHNGRWMQMENPLEHTSRDAERVRRWFAGTERDFVLKVFAALVTNDPTISRTPNCAVVTQEQISAWLTSLPPARALTADRREEVVERISALI